MNTKEALKKAVDILKKAQIETAVLDAQIILSNILNIPRWKLIIEDINLSKKQEEEFFEKIKKRAERYPVAYIIEEKEFYGLNFKVNEGVLIPRPETEILVEETLKRIKNKKNPIGLEIGIGSGAISISLLKNKPDLRMIATDISDKAIQVAIENAKIHNVLNRLKIIKTDKIRGINEKFDFIVSNPPYIPLKEYENLMPEVKKEPKEALIAKDEGLEFYKEIIKKGKDLLKEDGFFAFEVGYNQAEKVENILQSYGFKAEKIKDLQQIDRVVIGEKQ
ncbi:peptide chain release factor N(5)-glutamine methyltransferase [Hydrogenothermus marinus]|uniref:Release factor glutamine methyltransferase n=1 Tax=Hydrogenothermus marinus TaxID=133270 RepID=A0A3M0BI01_9AQUI|nr:peptide chain release factor N(5)-glutamine methyltransferase [Hydrogenothermus marinus]RMA97043.1 release factor glutamine methyltransferase [Hydrogenothermus marinus]